MDGKKVLEVREQTLDCPVLYQLSVIPEKTCMREELGLQSFLNLWHIVELSA